MRFNSLILMLFILFTWSLNTKAQGIGEWNAFTSVRTINDLTQGSKDNIWAATNGGVLNSDREGEYNIYTTIDGLSRLDGRAIAYDNEQNRIFVGYINGLIDIINLNENDVQTLNDIERSSNFTSKQINDFQVYERQLYVATDFGIVVYNLDNLFVQNSYIQIGNVTRAIPVNDIYITNDTLYASTPEGIGFGDIYNELSIKSNWEIYNQNNSPISEEVLTIGSAENFLYASTANENYVLTNGNWSNFAGFNGEVISEYIQNLNGTLGAHSENSVYIHSGDTTFSRKYSGSLKLLSAIFNESDVIVGTAINGIGISDDPNANLQLVEIPGPYQNYFKGLNFEEGILLAASTNESARNATIDRAKGYYIFDGSEWKNYNRRTSEVLDSFGFQQAFTTTVTDSYYYIGSWGRGVVRHHKESNEIHVFDETNSTLRGYVDDDPLFPVISGLEADSFEDVWLVSRYGDSPLYYQRPGEEDWVPIPKANAASNSDQYLGLFVDSFDQKWISLQSVSVSGAGLLILDTGTDPRSTSDDASVKLTSNPNNGNLPDDQINAIIQDKNDEVWIGTERGIARFIFPELIIEGGANERQAQWLINEDTTATSRFLLRDVNVSTMAVNAANEKWIGSVNQGIWVLNAEGSRIIKRFTVENSPLYSNNISSITINGETGEVFIATESGLISYLDIPKAPVNKMNTLKVFPNPFAYSRNNQIVIEGLSDETNIKVLGVDGTVVQQLSARGGRTNWNGLDYNGNELGSGVYYVVAYEKSGRQTGIGKVVIIR